MTDNTPSASAARYQPDDFVTSDDLARVFKLKPRTPELWRLKGTGPKFIRLNGKNVIYRWGDVDEFLRSRTFTSTSQESVAA